MKILYIAHEGQLNGASKSLLDLIHEYEGKHKIYVLTAFNYGPFYEELKKTSVQIIVKPYYRWVIKRENHRQWILENFKWIIKRRVVNKSTIRYVSDFCLKHEIDIIHTNSGVIDIGAQIAHITQIKHVWHIREFADLDFEMYPYISKSKYRSALLNGADSFICNSYAVARHYGFISSKKLNVVYNGVSLDNFIERTKREADTINFLIAGRYSAAKGQDEAINASQLLIKQGIYNFILNIAGSMTEKIAIPESLKENIVIYGEVKNMPKLRKSMDVELVCSRAEAFGRVTIEAMMGGMPVIGSNTGGTVELIESGVNGLLYEYNNISDLALKMKYMIDNSVARFEMGKRAQEYAIKFDTKTCAQKIETIYYKTLKGYENDCNKQK